MNDLSAEYALIAVLTAVVLIAVGFLMWWGWRNRKRRQRDLPAPAPVPARLLEAEPLAGAEGMYVSTVRGRDYLDRVAVHGLGVRTTARLEVHPEGVAVLRQGSANFLIPAADLVEVGLDSGMSGKFVERGGLLVVTWRLGDHEVSTGFRTRTAGDRDPLRAAVASIVHHPHGPAHAAA